ncbi:MAG: alpha/beta hydrolase [Leptospiraceae bacterium]|nr:alpha/beta hydrolase [Leptospiraceae bacterium]
MTVQGPLLFRPSMVDPQESEAGGGKRKRFFNTVAGLLKTGGYRGRSILNGIVGNHLHRQAPALAIPFQLRSGGRTLALTKKDLADAIESPSNKICVFVHGLTDDELVWNYKREPGRNYGMLLERDLAYTPLFVRYNTGLHVSENGRLFAEMMEQLFKNYPHRINEITMIGHSMGGLVTRSAASYATDKKKKWVRRLKNVIMIGTPHLGAPLEKLGHIATRTLLSIPLLPTRIVGRVANMRSDGIKDLRHGYTEDREWSDGSQDRWFSLNKSEVQLLKHVRYFVISGSLTRNPDHPVSFILGDSLVRNASASGKSIVPEFELKLSPDRCRQFPGFSHASLAHHPAVYRQLRKWLQQNSDWIAGEPKRF